ncbi:MAG: hybrid sensor histidine kinase/response regulator [Chloroflexi bacterium]|nr:hybrid sensor histidine kinase/response regulator [Chloroflexota bacterium]
MDSPFTRPDDSKATLMRESNLRLNLEDLRGQLTLRLAGLLLIIAQLIVLVYNSPVPFPLNMILFWLSLTSLGLLILWLRESHPTLTRHIFVWGTTAELIIAMILFPNTWLPYVGLVLVFSNSMLAHSSEFITAVFVGFTAVLLNQNGLRQYELGPFLSLLIVSVMVATLASRTLYTTLDWLWHMHQQSRELLVTTRQQQVELHAMIKSLRIVNDIRERNEYELMLAHKEAQSAKRLKEQFAANISHELRTPLSIILGFSEVMYLSPEVYGDSELPQTLLRDIAQIYRNSRHLLGMVDDILDLSRFEMVGFTLKKELTYLPTLLNEAAAIVQNLFEQSEDVVLHMEIDSDLPKIDVDQTRIRQVLLNLLNNAHRFTIKGSVTLLAEQEDNTIIIRVRDTGPGIPTEKIGDIFTEFYQVDHSLSRSHGGAGLGLAICQRFVEAHDGRIWLESEEGVGTIFSFSLPLEEPLHSTPYLYRQRLEPDEKEIRPALLFVESDPQLLNLVTRHLANYEVVAVASAAEVEQQAEAYHPLAVLYNVQSDREGEKVLETAVSVPIIECSIPSQSWMASTLGAVAALTKPIDFEQLHAEIAQVENGQGNPVQEILVIDDTPGICQLIERSLGADNGRYTIRIAYEGSAGLQAMAQQRPDLIILDLIMPKTDGFAVIQQMKANPTLAEVPIILLTATTYIENALAQYANQIKIVQTRPWHPAETLHFLDTILAGLKPKVMTA